MSSLTLGFQPLEPLNSEENPRHLVWDLGHTYQSNLKSINTNLLNGKVKNQPWSGDYWSESLGSIGFRYSDPWLQETLAKKNLEYTSSRRRSEKRAKKQSSIVRKNLKSFPVTSYIEQGRINQLSPAEKYDLLLGDKSQTLSRAVTDQALCENCVVVDPETGKEKKYKSQLWNGMCDGTSAASIIEKRPLKPVTVTGANGHKITFYPDDLKALMTLYWFENEPEHNLIGGDANCSRRNGCYGDVNPAAWHLALINQVGKNKIPLLFDRDSGPETWNYPINSYRFHYFNMVTGKETQNYEEALVKRSEIYGDDFARFRSKKSKYLLSVLMDVQYVAGRNAAPQVKDGPEQDDIKTMSLHYDLEIDENYEIIGGEWLWDTRPDMVWMPVQDMEKSLSIEKELGLSWDGVSPISLASKVAASGGEIDGKQVPSQSERLLPLPHIFRRLVEMAQ